MIFNGFKMMTMPEEKTRPRQTRELARRLGLLTEAQAAAGWGIIIILAALLGAIYLNQASKIATIGRRIQSEQQLLDELRLKNADLERQIAEAQSLERLMAESQRLGFVASTPADIDYVVIPNYPSEPVWGTPIEEEPPPRPQPPETMLEAITLAIRAMGIGLTRGEVSEQ
jgi:cell division protein FtsL